MNIYEDIDLTKFPQKLYSKNILNAIIEIRFDTDIPQEILAATVISSLYSSENIQKKYDKPIATNFNNIPPIIRRSDPNLKNAILYSLDSKDSKFRIGCGDKFISLSNLNFAYETWNVFIAEFKTIFEILKSSNHNLLKSITQLGIRYINVFDENIFNNLNIKLEILNENICDNDLRFSVQSKVKNRNIIIQISNNINYKFLNVDTTPKQVKEMKGSAFDIDVILTDKNKLNIDTMFEIEESHNVLKTVFFGTLKQAFIDELLKDKE